ncbi:1,4-alpha-glucan branching protein domain-containing protein [Brevibacillus sp. TJ4]|uniref:1,4-alpha-glucan branching protein domain-containing protein n=1 Tax=Brevibacillus sp. TJ4 TaxID=3234853 RepID=UPI0037D6C8ED
MADGYFSLVLHAHLPYVRHADRADRLEERWVYEAMLESYIPLMLMCEKLLADGIPYRLTLAVSPTLLSMLDDGLIQSRFYAHLAKSVELAGREIKRTENQPQEQRLAKMYLERFREIASYCRRVDYQLVRALQRLQDSGCVELITCAATHAFLPLVETEEAIRAQINIGIDTHERILGRRPEGIWLPECGYTPGLDRLLVEAGLRYFFVDSHTIQHATPEPRRGLYAPLLTPHGAAAFARDEAASRQVWSSFDGYPGDYDYREYYRDIGFDRDIEYIHPYIHPTGLRVHTGLKYHRITGPDSYKEWYQPERAKEKAAEHAGHFLHQREQQVEEASSWLDRKPLIVATYDAELFGHWWYEGPQFLDFLLRKTACDSTRIQLVTPSDYLDLYQENDRARLPMSSWGRNGYAEVWLNEHNGWIYRHLHQAEREMIEVTSAHVRKMAVGDAEQPALLNRALRQAARELLLAQSSDWAFIMDGQTVVEYAVRRVHDHLVRFRELADMLRQGQPDEAKIAAYEAAYPLFPALSERYYLPAAAHRVNVSQQLVAVGMEPRSNARVLMLSWEFPPDVIGGLGKAVYDLARHLVRLGQEVHVLTAASGSRVGKDIVEGIHVHRVRPYLALEKEDFLHWVFQLNLAMVDEAQHLYRNGLRPNVIHAHDWLVGWAGMELRERWSRPLVTTVHATEHGRNQGIHTVLQQRIHECEELLVHRSDRVIVCSQYMREEVQRLFAASGEKLHLIYNGVELPDEPSEAWCDKARVWRQELCQGSGPLLFFVGRLVREKGCHVLLEALPELVGEFPGLTLVIAGKGPMRGELEQLSERLGIAQHVRFLGFVEDWQRNMLFRIADIAVFPSLYEPFGIVALEAMSYGTPLVVADTGGLREIVRHQENGMTIYAGDVQSLVNQVRWLLHQPQMRAHMATVAKEDVRRTYNWAHLAQQTAQLYSFESKGATVCAAQPCASNPAEDTLDAGFPV